MTFERRRAWSAIVAWAVIAGLPGCADGGVPFCDDPDGGVEDVAEAGDGDDDASADADDVADDDGTGDVGEDFGDEDAADDSDGGPVVPGLDCQACTVDSDCAEGFPCVARRPAAASACARAT